MTETILRRLVLALLGPVLVLATGCQTLRALEQQTTYYTISPEQEAELGLQYNEELSSQLDYITDPIVENWVQDLGESLVEHSPETAQEFTFQVTTDPAVNAFAIPGGFCYINAGLILKADNEAQVAAVVAHEINHVTARHGVRSLQRAAGLDLLAQALASENQAAASAVQVVQQAGGLVAMRSFGRHDEREADRLGVEAMYKAGYDPREAAEFFQKLKDMEGDSAGGSKLSEIVSTHPATDERIQNIREQVSQYSLGNDLIKNRPIFDQVKEIVKKEITTVE